MWAERRGGGEGEDEEGEGGKWRGGKEGGGREGRIIYRHRGVRGVSQSVSHLRVCE